MMEGSEEKHQQNLEVCNFIKSWIGRCLFEFIVSKPCQKDMLYAFVKSGLLLSGCQNIV